MEYSPILYKTPHPGWVDNCEISTASEIRIKLKVNIDVYVVQRVCVQQKFGKRI